MPKSKLNTFVVVVVETYCECFKKQIFIMHVIIKMLREMFCFLFKSSINGFIHVF